MPEAEYRSIPGFPGYVAGDDGSIWSCWKRHRGAWMLTETRQRRLKEQIVKPTKAHPRNKPYRWVGLTVDGRRFIRYVHQLVLLAFVGPCPQGCESRHGGRDVSDNRRSNLCYGTKSENWADKRSQGTATIGERNGVGEMTAEDILEIRQAKANGEVSRVVAARKGISAGAVRMIWSRQTWKHI